MTTNELLNWDGIVDRHVERVLRVAMRILGSVQDAEDVSQEVFTEAFKLHKAGPVQSWTGLLVRLATLRSIDWLRRRRSTQALTESDRMTSTEPIDDIMAKELAEMLRQSIKRLPEQQAAIFVLTHIEKMSRNEVAVTLGISPEAVSTALYKGRQQLLTQLSCIYRGASE